MRATCKKCGSIYTGTDIDDIKDIASKWCRMADCHSNIEKEDEPMSMRTKWIKNMQEQVKSKKQLRKENAALLRAKMAKKEEEEVE